MCYGDVTWELLSLVTTTSSYLIFYFNFSGLNSQLLRSPFRKLFAPLCQFARTRSIFNIPKALRIIIILRAKLIELREEHLYFGG